jgi:3-oxoacyl-[acyl-carrier protein] reductase
MKDINDHVAVVTGAARGIGAAIARRLANRGAAVVINGLTEASAETIAASLRAQGGRAVAACGDISSEQDVDRVFETCRRAFGPCSLLVNNAGYEQRVPFDSLSVADWDRMIGVHLRGTFLCCRAAIPDMLAAGDGIIVNIVSRIGQTGGVDVSHYAASKAGVIGLTKSLAREFSGRGIRVNAVAPGPIVTDIAASFPPGWKAERLKELPLGCFGEPDDVADTVEFLASPAARLYVGQTFGLNSGGLMLG